VRRVSWLFGVVVLAVAPRAHAVEPPVDDGPLVRAMRDELTRSAEQLRLPDAEKPYYLALRLHERTDVGAVASFGALVRKYTSHGRYLRADVRVGDYVLDNSNFGGARPNVSFERLPIEDDYDVIRLDVWHAMDRAYKQAAGDYARKMAAHKTQNQSPDDVGDFSSEKASRIVVRRASQAPDVERAASIAKELSAAAKNFPEIQSSDVAVNGGSWRQLFLSNEGTFADEDDALVTLTATLRTQAVDGMPLTRVVSFSAASLDALPPRDVLEREFARVAQELTALRRAPEAEDYAGPVLFEAEAAAQLVRDVLAPQLCGTPAPKSEGAGRAGLETELSGRIGQRVMPAGFRVEDDPTIDRLGALALVSRYGADDEGVAAQKVTLIEHGLLERFLMSRTPRKGFEHSNGHGRAMFVMPPRAAVSNLLVSADKGSSAGDLRKKLVAEAKAQGLSYGLVVKVLDDATSSGNFATMSRGGDGVPPPLVLVKVTADGKEEPVRGATFGALPLRAFEESIAAGREPAVVSRAFPTASSVVAPALLFKRVEVKKPQGAQRKVPVLPQPYFAEKK
jgi:hypothetical protein